MLLYSFNSIPCPALLTVNVFEPCHLWCVVCAMCNVQCAIHPVVVAACQIPSLVSMSPSFSQSEHFGKDFQVLPQSACLLSHHPAYWASCRLWRFVVR